MILTDGGLSTAEGAPTSNVPLRASKGWLYEGGIREPLLIRWPGKTRSGSVCDVPVTSTDFYPTMLEIAGLPLEPQQHCDGESMVPLLDADFEPQRTKPLFWHYPHYSNQGGRPACAVRAGDWKLIRHFETENLELFNVPSDLSEQTDLAA
jgi:arylsulfatase A-like enzyme